MRNSSLQTDIVEWAQSESDGPSSLPLDRESPDTIRALKAALTYPLAIETVERIEHVAKLLWADVLRPNGILGGSEAAGCGKFFSDLGFLYKHKPYGTKIASPFGYSVFDLRDGEGFSYQVHTEPKLEGFHILQTKGRSLVYISTRDEWLQQGETWARQSHAKADLSDCAFVWRPEIGDVIAVAETETVHSVLGCVLEEYASCSVDAVERLYDQNARATLTLPSTQPDLASLLRFHRGGPVRRVDRSRSGWSVRDWSSADAIIDVDGGLWGCRVPIASDEPFDLRAKGEMLSLVIAVDHPLFVEVDGVVGRTDVGCFRCLPPGLDARITAARNCFAAIHRVSRELVAADWTR